MRLSIRIYYLECYRCEMVENCSAIAIHGRLVMLCDIHYCTAVYNTYNSMDISCSVCANMEYHQ